MEVLPTGHGCAECSRLRALVEEQQKQIEQLHAQIRDLQSRLDQNSSNSHKPPSSDPPWINKLAPKKPTGNRPGGQKGHRGHCRKRLPAQRVDRVVDHVPTHCKHCQAALPQEACAQDPPPRWHQVAELPQISAIVTEHRGHARTCGCCGKVTRQPIPADVLRHVTGPRLSAVMSYLAGRCHDGRRTVQEVVHDLFGVPLSLGTIVNREAEMSQALSAAHDQALTSVRSAPVKHADETGWKLAGKLYWLWTAVSQRASCFLVDKTRGRDGADALLGQDAGHGVVITDRYKAYGHIPLERRQLCWAHLKREFQKWVEKGKTTRLLGDDGLKLCGRTFALWRDFRQGKRSRAALGRAAGRLRKKMKQVLNWGLRCQDSSASRFCRALLKLEAALWTFARVPGVEPTNNPAERALRPAVLWRKNSFGSNSEAGCRFVERMLTAVQTLRQTGRNVLEFLCQTLSAHRSGTPLPQLVTKGD
jgi:transposase